MLKIAHEETWTTVKTEELRVPTEWAMYTKAGNRRLQKLGQKAYDKIEKLVQDGKATEKTVRKVLVSYIAEWERIGNTKTCAEAGDTAVREVVADFHDKLWKSVFGYVDYIEWENNRDAAWHKSQRKKSS